MFTVIKKTALAALRAISTKYDALVIEYDALVIERDNANETIARLQSVQATALLLVTNNGPFFQKLTSLSGVETPAGTIMGTLGSDQQSVVVDLGAAAFVLNPWAQTITVNDVGGTTKITPITVSCADGHISVDDRERVLGHVQRILVNADTGTDPVMVSDLVEVGSTA